MASERFRRQSAGKMKNAIAPKGPQQKRRDMVHSIISETRRGRDATFRERSKFPDSSEGFPNAMG
jgi:hypothetical protein